MSVIDSQLNIEKKHILPKYILCSVFFARVPENRAQKKLKLERYKPTKKFNTETK